MTATLKPSNIIKVFKDCGEIPTTFNVDILFPEKNDTIKQRVGFVGPFICFFKEKSDVIDFWLYFWNILLIKEKDTDLIMFTKQRKQEKWKIHFENTNERELFLISMLQSSINVSNIETVEFSCDSSMYLENKVSTKLSLKKMDDKAIFCVKKLNQDQSYSKFFECSITDDLFINSVANAPSKPNIFNKIFGTKNNPKMFAINDFIFEVEDTNLALFCVFNISGSFEKDRSKFGKIDTFIYVEKALQKLEPIKVESQPVSDENSEHKEEEDKIEEEEDKNEEEEDNTTEINWDNPFGLDDDNEEDNEKDKKTNDDLLRNMRNSICIKKPELLNIEQPSVEKQEISLEESLSNLENDFFDTEKYFQSSYIFCNKENDKLFEETLDRISPARCFNYVDYSENSLIIDELTNFHNKGDEELSNLCYIVGSIFLNGIKREYDIKNVVGIISQDFENIRLEKVTPKELGRFLLNNQIAITVIQKEMKNKSFLEMYKRSAFFFDRKIEKFIFILNNIMKEIKIPIKNTRNKVSKELKYIMKCPENIPLEINEIVMNEALLNEKRITKLFIDIILCGSKNESEVKRIITKFVNNDKVSITKLEDSISKIIQKRKLNLLFRNIFSSSECNELLYKTSCLFDKVRYEETLMGLNCLMLRLKKNN